MGKEGRGMGREGRGGVKEEGEEGEVEERKMIHWKCTRIFNVVRSNHIGENNHLICQHN